LTVYRHFATRQDLLGELVYRSFGIAVENSRAAAAHPGSVETARAGPGAGRLALRCLAGQALAGCGVEGAVWSSVWLENRWPTAR
jgi:hypothetical protein